MPREWSKESKALAKRYVARLKKNPEKAEAFARQSIERCPDFAAVFAELGRSCLDTEADLVKSFAGGVALAGIEENLKVMRRDLGYETAPPLEKMLIDRLVVCWLRVQQAEMIKNRHEATSIKLEWATALDKRLEIANRNFLRSARTLAMVRRLPLPRTVTQVNIDARGALSESGKKSLNPADGEGT